MSPKSLAGIAAAEPITPRLGWTERQKVIGTPSGKAVFPTPRNRPIRPLNGTNMLENRRARQDQRIDGCGFAVIWQQLPFVFRVSPPFAAYQERRMQPFETART